MPHPFTCKTLLTIAAALCLCAPLRAQEREDAAAFVEVLKSRQEALRFEADHGESWGELWAPGAVYAAPAEVTGGVAPAGLQAAIDEIWAAQDEEWARPFGLEVRGQAPVEAFVRFWAGRGRATLARSLSRMGRYEVTLREILREEGVPEDFLYLCLIESAFSPRALSPANARGLWQFIPATASHYGLRIDAEVDERLDPVRATRAAARYLRDLKQQLGSWPLAMAGYNAGAGHVLTAISRGNSNSYWSLARRGALYDGARTYVAKILAAALIGRNRERFDFHRIVPEEPWRFEVVEVPGGASLAELARMAEATPEELRALNPELLLGRTPGRRPTYDLRVPPGGALRVAQGLSQRPLAPEEGFLTYTTRLGESVEVAAARLGVREPVLRAASGLPAEGRAPYGTPLRAPRAALEAALGRPLPDEDALQAALEERERASRGRAELQATALLPAVRFDYPERQRAFYETQAGDRLSELEEHLGIPAPLIQMWNGLEPRDELPRGLILQLFVPQGALPREAVLLADGQVRALYEGEAEYQVEYGRNQHRGPAGSGGGGGKTYRVKNGESVASVARRFNVSADDLRRWNNLRGNQLKAGYRLVIFGGKDSGAAPVAAREDAPARAAASPAPAREASAPPAARRAGPPPPRSAHIRYQRR